MPFVCLCNFPGRDICSKNPNHGIANPGGEKHEFVLRHKFEKPDIRLLRNISSKYCVSLLQAIPPEIRPETETPFAAKTRPGMQNKRCIQRGMHRMIIPAVTRQNLCTARTRNLLYLGISMI